MNILMLTRLPAAIPSVAISRSCAAISRLRPGVSAGVNRIRPEPRPAIPPGTPRLQCGAGNLQLGSGLPLGQPFGLQVTILPQEFGTLEAIPALVTIFMALSFAAGLE